MELPAFLFGTHKQVVGRSRRRLKKILDGEDPARVFGGNESLSLSDRPDALVVLVGRAPALGDTAHFRPPALVDAICGHDQSTTMVRIRETWQPLLEFAWTSPWCFLIFVSGMEGSALAGDRQQRWQKLIRTAAGFAPEYEAAGPRFSDGLAGGDFWSAAHALRLAVADSGRKIPKNLQVDKLHAWTRSQVMRIAGQLDEDANS